MVTFGMEMLLQVANRIASVRDKADALPLGKPLCTEHSVQAASRLQVKSWIMAKHLGPPLLGMLLPTITSNQPALRLLPSRAWT